MDAGEGSLRRYMKASLLNAACSKASCIYHHKPNSRSAWRCALFFSIENARRWKHVDQRTLLKEESNFHMCFGNVWPIPPISMTAQLLAAYAAYPDQSNQTSE